MGTEAHTFAGRHKLAHELKEYAGIALYLYVCFGAILLYKWAVLEAHGIGYAHYGLAAVKALILAKFMLFAHEVHIGDREKGKPLIHAVLYESTIFLIVLAALLCVEELVVGAIHGRTMVQSLSEIAGGTWLEIVATCFLMWLILLPYFGFREIRDALGPDEWRRMLFGAR
jgi:hypothetical protein